jgi:L-2,4-diaminobutyrate decarboxylase
MQKKPPSPIYSGADPDQVASDLAPLVDFQEEGLPLGELNKLAIERLLPHFMRYDQPSFQSMFNAFPEEGAEMGASIALSYNQGVTNWQVSPGSAMLEELCCRALCKLFGLAPGADATFMYCGTYANQQAVYLAIHRYDENIGIDFSQKGLHGFQDASRLTVLASADAHFSLKHAVRILGLGEQSLFKLDVDETRRIDMERMEKTITALKETKDIFCAVATAGTTSTGSVDPVLPMAELCKEHGIWLHVDGAYGLAYSLVPEWKPKFSGIELADSVSWDPHKQFGVPIPSSILFLRQKEDFDRMSVYGDYFNRKEDPEPNPGLKSPPSTRPLSALPLVTSIRHLGLAGLKDRLRAPLEAIKAAAAQLTKEPDIEVCHEPDTGILCFRLTPEDIKENELNQLQERLYREVIASGRRTLSITKLDDKAVLRLVSVSPKTSSEDMMETIAEVREIAGALP